MKVGKLPRFMDFMVCSEFHEMITTSADQCLRIGYRRVPDQVWQRYSMESLLSGI